MKLKLLMLLLLVPSSVAATEGGTGMLFGVDHAFSFTVAQGWVLDNKSGVRQGLHMVFYPLGQSWSRSPVIAYGVSVRKDSKLRTIEDQVKATVEQFQVNGSPKYRQESKEVINLRGGKKAHIYFFHGDQWGNYEAAGYIEEPETINFLVYNARNKAEFEKHLPAFRSTIVTYRNMFESATAKDLTKFESLIMEAKALENTKEGKAYVTEAFKTFGKDLAKIMKSCTDYTKKGEEARFDLLLGIRCDGVVSEAFIRPTNALTSCVRGLVMDTNLPPHEMDKFLMHIEMSVKE